jgi:hypothetical protein
VATQGQELLPGERVVASSGVVTVTNFRVLRDDAAVGRAHYVSITLDSISSCGLVTNSQPMLLVLGIIVAVAGLALRAMRRLVD